MRNENLHQMVVVGTDSKRIFITDLEVKPGDDWGFHGAAVFGKWMHDNHGYKLMDSRFENGQMINWVAKLH